MSIKKPKKENSQEETNNSLNPTELSQETTESKQEEDKKIPESSAKELYWVFGVMAGLVVVFFIAYYFFQSLNHFENPITGLTFYKEDIGDIKFYHAQFPIERQTGELVNYNLYLRTDPRNNNIPVSGEISLVKDLPIFVTISSEATPNCKYTQAALGSLSQFLNAAGFTVKGAVTDENLSLQSNGAMPYVTCASSPSNNVILVQSGEQTKIEQDSSNGCYIISVNNCEILQAIEKFELQTIADAKARKQAIQPL